MRDERPGIRDERESTPCGPAAPRPSSLVPHLSSLIPLLLISAGVASVIYGARYRLVPVVSRQVEVRVVEEEEEVTIRVPSPFSPVLPEGLADPEAGGPSADVPRMEPPPGFAEPTAMKVKKITYVPKKVIKEVVNEEPEPVLVWEVTVGGVALAESGILERTYGPTESGEPSRPPSLCPS